MTAQYTSYWKEDAERMGAIADLLNVSTKVIVSFFEELYCDDQPTCRCKRHE